MGPRLLPILSALKDTLAFFIVTGTCILAATHAYYNLQLREEPIPTYGAFLQVMLRLVLGFFPAVLLYWDMFLFFWVNPNGMACLLVPILRQHIPIWHVWER